MVIMSKLYRGERPHFSRADAPLALMHLVSRCLEHDPSKRPASMWEVHIKLKAILLQLPNASPPSTLAALLSQPALVTPSYDTSTGAIRFTDVSMTSDFAAFVRARVRREAAGVTISRICSVQLGGTRAATYLDLFLREAGSRSSNPMLRPANPTHTDFVNGLKKLQTFFESTCLGASPPCNIVFVPVKYCGRLHCVTGKALPLDTDYQAAHEGIDASKTVAVPTPACAFVTLLRISSFVFSLCSGERACCAVSRAGASRCSCLAAPF